jgi:hypothetical protein
LETSSNIALESKCIICNGKMSAELNNPGRLSCKPKVGHYYSIECFYSSGCTVTRIAPNGAYPINGAHPSLAYRQPTGGAYSLVDLYFTSQPITIMGSFSNDELLRMYKILVTMNCLDYSISTLVQKIITEQVKSAGTYSKVEILDIIDSTLSTIMFI